MLTLTLPFPPSVNRLWRAGKDGKVYRSPKYTAWRKEAMWELKAQAKSQKVCGSYKLTLLAVKPDKRKRDIGNLEKAVSDILVTMGIIEDDNLCEWLEARWVPEGAPFTVIIEAMGVGHE